jgi:hypothetical protein
MHTIKVEVKSCLGCMWCSKSTGHNAVKRRMDTVLTCYKNSPSREIFFGSLNTETFDVIPKWCPILVK